MRFDPNVKDDLRVVCNPEELAAALARGIVVAWRNRRQGAEGVAPGAGGEGADRAASADAAGSDGTALVPGQGVCAEMFPGGSGVET